VEKKEDSKAMTYAAGNTIISDVNDVKTLGSTSWKTSRFKLPNDIKTIRSSDTGHELIIETAGRGQEVFFVPQGMQIFIEPDINVRPGDNAVKVTVSPDGKFCVSGTGQNDYCPQTICKDEDGDGVSTCDGDCDDTNPNIKPGAPDECNKLDDNCNDKVDEAYDSDLDGYPYSFFGQGSDDYCQEDYGTYDDHPENYDCEATRYDPLAHPGAIEQCNFRDDNCDELGLVDENVPTEGKTCGDIGSYGNCNGDEIQCSTGMWACSFTSRAQEICNDAGLEDEDCDGHTNDADEDCSLLFYVDYNSVPAIPQIERYYADITQNGNQIPLPLFDATRVPLVAGINDTGVSILDKINPANDPLMKYDATNNFNAEKGTIQFWVRSKPGFNMWSDNQQRTFFSLIDSSGTNYLRLTKGVYAGQDQIALEYIDPADQPRVVYSTIVTESWDSNNWYLFTLEWDFVLAPDTVTLYADETAYPLSVGNQHFRTDYSMLGIGHSFSTIDQGDQIVDAIIDEFRIYSGARALSQMQDELNFFVCAVPCPSATVGDVNYNSVRDFRDYTYIQYYAIGHSDWVPDCSRLYPSCFDVDQNCVVNMDDVNAFLALGYTGCAPSDSCYPTAGTFTDLDTCIYGEQGGDSRFCASTGLYAGSYVDSCGTHNCGCPPASACENDDLCHGQSSGGGSPLFRKPPTTIDRGIIPGGGDGFPS
jgi:hypothetical protein